MRSPWAWRNWMSVGSTFSRFAAPPILPPPLGIMKVGRNARAFLGNAADKRRLRTAWGCVYDTMKVGRNARAFLGNAAGRRRLRTAWGSVYDTMKVGRNATAFLENAAGRRRLRTAWGSVHGIIKTMNGEVALIKGKLLHVRSAFHLTSVHIPNEILQNQEQAVGGI